MENNLRQNAEKYNRRNKLKRLWHRIVSVLGCIVVFCTTYALILPAITQERTTFCGKEPHVHDQSCYTQILETNIVTNLATDSDADPKLICTIPEIRYHIHDESCYIEQSGHKHEETCYTSEEVLFCTVEKVDTGASHIHTEACVTEATLTCVIEEFHEHDTGCYTEPQLICSCTATDSNAHSEACYSERTLRCETEAGHIHTDSCYSLLFMCAEPETSAEASGSAEHSHDESCYGISKILVCDLQESDGGRVLTCEIPEMRSHTHDENCYEKSDAAIQEKTELPLTCEQEEDDAHKHDKYCYGTWELNCGLEEHTHGLICYSDPASDVETESVWKRTFEDVELTGVWADDVLAIAKTQLGYHESTKNYLVTEEEETKGYTRYGAWYGDPYGDWCAMFISFCLHYAEVEGIELEANCQDWLEKLSDESVQLYHEAGTYEWKPGDLIFFDMDEDGTSDHIGIVEGATVASESNAEPASASNAVMIKTIEGNSANRVRYVTYAPEDPRILGFGELPKNPKLEHPDKHVHGNTCYDETGEIICGFADETDLSEAQYHQVAQVIRLIEKLPTADEIDETIMEFEEAEDYEGEELWLMEIYRQVGLVYRRYDGLPQELQEYVWNRDKLLEMEYIWSVAKLIETEIGKRITYTAGMFTSEAKYVVYTQSGDEYYAFDGYGNAVPIHIDASGTITADIIDQDELLWTFTSQGGSTYTIYNMHSGRYMHAYPQNGSSVVSSGAYTSVVEAKGDGAQIRSNSSYAYLDAENKVFKHTQDANAAVIYEFGAVYRSSMRSNYVWLDGTNGGLRSLAGSPNISYEVYNGQVVTLPYEWKSPDKYAYTLRGWYDVRNSRYYAPGSKVTVNDNMVFYADWVAETYDIGQFNAQVSDAISTKDFIDINVFDYSSMFNVLSQNVSVSVDGNGHTEQWTLVPNGRVSYQNAQSLGFIFRDYDGGGDITIPSNLDAVNTSDDVYPGLYDPEIAYILFGTDNEYNPETGEGVLGKSYLGEGDYLFRYGTDPSNKATYGYYYYDSRLNAASYNQSEQRFYVYDYLERTSDSARDGGEDGYADFLPLNSMYANTNGKDVRVYQYNGDYGEYAGINHIMYDVQYNTEGCSTGNVGTNFWFGMSTEMEFYLPNRPGTTDAEGNPGNQSIYGDDMLFEFSGDDDVWVLIDGKLELDIGGIHAVKSGSINFTTGQVIVDGELVSNVRHIEPGEHTLTLYYLERGSSKSNCKIRFNLSPRYMLTLQKEDVLTRELLNGAEFSVFTDLACTIPAKLWTSKESYNNHESSTNVFTVQKGQATIWGFAAGNTYYIKETRSPYGDSILTNGVIRMTLDNQGTSSYAVIGDPNTGALSGGFTVHGVKVDYESQEAFLVATNGENVTEVTSIYVKKKWNDTKDHSLTSIPVYLLADGNRIREVTLDANNDWSFTWENMPKHYSDGKAVHYSVQEGTVPGYLGKVEPMTEDTVISTTWTTASNFTDGAVHLIKTNNGYLAYGSNYYWITDEAAAKASLEARWKSTASGYNQYTLTNEAGKTMFYASSCFQAAANPSVNTPVMYRDNDIVYDSSYMGPLTNGVMYTAWSYDSRLKITLIREVAEKYTKPIGENSYLITNTPVTQDQTVSVTVKKQWDLGTLGTKEMYEDQAVRVRLLENGIDAGLIETLSLKNNWTASFTWLPKNDEKGNPIVYTVEEVPIEGPWNPVYGEVKLITGTTNQYEVTITNVCNLIYELPQTGGSGIWTYITGAILSIIISIQLLLYRTKRCNREEGRTSL